MQSKPLTSILLGVPDDYISPEGRVRLGNLLQAMDELGRLDQETQEVSIDEASLHRLASEFITPQFATNYITHLKMLADSRLTSDMDPAKKLTPISWLTLAGRTKVFAPLADPLAALDGLGISQFSPGEEIRKAVQTRFPDIPNVMFDPQALKREVDSIIQSQVEGTPEAATRPLASWGSILECCEARLPWWEITAAIVLIGAALIALALSGGIWSLFWPVFISMASAGVSLSILVVVGNCALNS